jgi:hypothetical protein
VFYDSMSKYSPSNTINTYISLSCKGQRVSALSSHHQTNLVYISLVHKVYAHVMDPSLFTVFVMTK